MLYFALPCLLLRFGINTPVLELLNPFVLLVYLVYRCADRQTGPPRGRHAQVGGILGD